MISPKFLSPLNNLGSIIIKSPASTVPAGLTVNAKQPDIYHPARTPAGRCCVFCVNISLYSIIVNVSPMTFSKCCPSQASGNEYCYIVQLHFYWFIFHHYIENNLLLYYIICGNQYEKYMGCPKPQPAYTKFSQCVIWTLPISWGPRNWS